MKWFKHHSDVRVSNSVSNVLGELGVSGYGRYWILLELMAQKFDGKNDDVFAFGVRELRESLRFNQGKQLISYLEAIAKQGVIEFQASDKLIEIRSSILLDLLGRDFKKARSGRAQTAPKKEIKKEKEIYSAVVKPRARKRQELFNPDGVEQLRSAIDQETAAMWSELYPDEEYQRRESLKCWNYYRDAGRKRPTTLAGWKRVMGSWFERGWARHAAGLSHPKASVVTQFPGGLNPMVKDSF